LMQVRVKAIVSRVESFGRHSVYLTQYRLVVVLDDATDELPAIFANDFVTSLLGCNLLHFFSLTPHQIGIRLQDLSRSMPKVEGIFTLSFHQQCKTLRSAYQFHQRHHHTPDFHPTTETVHPPTPQSPGKAGQAQCSNCCSSLSCIPCTSLPVIVSIEPFGECDAEELIQRVEADLRVSSGD